jgi:hypothetical protein
MGRKSGLFAHSLSSLDSGFAEVKTEIGESLRPSPRIFPFWRDYGRRPVRSRLPPEGGDRFLALIRFPNKSLSVPTGTVQTTDARFESRSGMEKGRLDRIAELQSTQATAEQVASLAARVEQRAPLDDDRLPPAFADREISLEVIRIYGRRGFIEAKTADEIANLADRIINGDLARASSDLQANVLERAARSNAHPETVERAKRFHAEALKRNPRLDTSFYDALLPAAEGNTDNTLRTLRQLDSPEARSALFSQLIRQDGPKKALEWIKSTQLGINDFDAGGALNLLLQRISNDEYDVALSEAEALPKDQLKALPALHTVRSSLLLSSILPKDQRKVPFQGIPINPRMLQFNSLENTPATLAKARGELETALTPIADLQLLQIRPFLDEQILWLKLEDKATPRSTKSV